ncbi:hypothetical protein [Spiroplasma endosymbiont of Lasioglossum malachurum]|uniref:hypothetical protein n=1 Tax=Spiroplasma endosymbiont of Lasioglossum malachurum TaxID=3066319 RepID=UPI0030CF159C
MIKLFFAIIFVFPLLGKLLPSLNNIVQNILQSYITDFSGLHNLSLVIKSFILRLFSNLCIFVLQSTSSD